MRGVGLNVEDSDTGDLPERLRNTLDDIAVPSFADIGHTFDDGHGRDSSAAVTSDLPELHVSAMRVPSTINGFA
jgi:hypothetical protein